MESIEKNLNDIAGVRVICSHPADIYKLSEAFLRQDDITLLERKDYIANPKPNGYRSLHLIVETPIFLHDQKRLMKVEGQFRTHGKAPENRSTGNGGKGSRPFLLNF